MLGYNYIRPSRRRCSLYAIREGLRVAREFCHKNLEQQQQTGTGAQSVPARATKYCITIVSDSNYCLDLLHNTSQILEWGQCENEEAFLEICSSGCHRVPSVNPDILYPLSCLYFKLRNLTDSDMVIYDIKFAKQCLGELGDAAQLAARMMYENCR